MSRGASPTLIGAFVVGAVALSVMAMILFGSGHYFRKTYKFVLYFSSSVNGLRVGAPVKFRGVQVGSVQNILLQLKLDSQVQHTPVIIDIDPQKIISQGGASTILNDPRVLQQAIDEGMRGQLQLESFVTGLLFVGFDFFPGSPAIFVQQPATHKYRYRELPTQPTSLEKAQGAVNQILAKLADTDFQALIDSATRVVSGISQLVSSPDVKEALRSLDNVSRQVGEAAAHVSSLATSVDGKVPVLAGDIQLTSAEARAAIKQFGEAVRQTQATINDSPTLYQLNRSLQEVAAAARSLRLLTSYLEENPRALLFGKPPSKEE